MNRATDEDVSAMQMAASERYVSGGSPDDNMRAAAEALLSRRMPTRERLREVAQQAVDVKWNLPHNTRMVQIIADAIYDELFGVTD